MTDEQKTEKVRRTNAAFDALDPAQKRVAIAKDVLRLLDARKLRAKSGTFIARLGHTGIVAFGDKVADEVDLGSYLAGVSCDVCALGALFYSAVVAADRLTAGELRVGMATLSSENLIVATNRDGVSPIVPYLSRFFDEDQVKLVEMAFERGKGVYGGLNVKDQTAARAALGMFPPFDDEDEEGEEGEEDDEDDDLRLREVMFNIIRNDGTFVPTDERRGAPGAEA